MSWDSHTKLDVLSSLVSMAATKFRSKPTGEFLGHVTNFLDRTMAPGEARKMLEQLPLDFDVFPSLAQIEVYRKTFTHKVPDTPKPPVEFWESTQAPGTPAWAEGMFLHIERGTTESRSFKYGLRANKLTEDDLWMFYEAWRNREVHPDLAAKALERRGAREGGGHVWIIP